MAGRAVDGDTSQYLNDSSCAHPYSWDFTLPNVVRETPAWWSVDLSAGDPNMTYIIRNVTIYFRLYSWMSNLGKLVCLKVLFSNNLLDIVDYTIMIICNCLRELVAFVSIICFSTYPD